MEQKNLTAWDRVTAARMPGRPTSQYFIDAIFDDFIEPVSYTHLLRPIRTAVWKATWMPIVWLY